MIGPKMLESLNAHVRDELYSSNLYLAMSAYCGVKSFKGFARWLRIQSQEERDHALKILDHLVARGGEAAVGVVEAPPREFGTITQVFEAIAAHERRVTERVHRLHEQAMLEKDPASAVFLQWFVAEQVEEEAAVVEILDKLRMVSDRPGSALYLDKEYGKRAG